MCLCNDGILRDVMWCEWRMQSLRLVSKCMSRKKCIFRVHFKVKSIRKIIDVRLRICRDSFYGKKSFFYYILGVNENLKHWKFSEFRDKYQTDWISSWGLFS